MSGLNGEENTRGGGDVRDLEDAILEEHRIQVDAPVLDPRRRQRLQSRLYSVYYAEELSLGEFLPAELGLLEVLPESARHVFVVERDSEVIFRGEQLEAMEADCMGKQVPMCLQASWVRLVSSLWTLSHKSGESSSFFSMMAICLPSSWQTSN
jgi:hypothetical protein